MNNLTIDILISLLFFFLGSGFTVLYDQKVKKRGKLALINPLEIQLFNKGISDLKSLKILYNEKPINEQIILFQGMIGNIGNIDLQMSEEKQAIKMHFPTEIKWLEFAIIECPSEVTSESKIIGEFATIYFDQLNVKEVITFRALLRVNLNFDFESIVNNLKIEHRILNAEKTIRTSFYEDLDNIEVKLFPYWWLIPTFGSIIFFISHAYSLLINYTPQNNSSFPLPPNQTPEIVPYEERVKIVMYSSIICAVIFFIIAYYFLYRRIKKNMVVRELKTK